MNAIHLNKLYDFFLKPINKLPITFKNETVDYCNNLIRMKKDMLNLISDRILTDKEIFNIIFTYLDFLCDFNISQRLLTKTVSHIDEWLMKIETKSLDEEYFETVQNIINWRKMRDYDFFKQDTTGDEMQ